RGEGTRTPGRSARASAGWAPSRAPPRAPRAIARRGRGARRRPWVGRPRAAAPCTPSQPCAGSCSGRTDRPRPAGSRIRYRPRTLGGSTSGRTAATRAPAVRRAPQGSRRASPAPRGSPARSRGTRTRGASRSRAPGAASAGPVRSPMLGSRGPRRRGPSQPRAPGPPPGGPVRPPMRGPRGPVSTPASETPSQPHAVTYSVVVPVFNEQGNVEALASSVVAAMERIGEPFELLFVDDGSRDRTPELLRKIAAREPRVRVVRFTRNYGQEAAVEALYLNARGRWLIQMDGDLQHPPDEIARLVAKKNEGYDVVYGVR